MLLRDRNIVLVLAVVLLTAFVGYGIAFAGCPQDSKWTAAEQRKSKEVLDKVLRDFDDLVAAKKRLDEDPNDYVARQVAKNAMDNIEKMAQSAFKDDLAAARLRSDKVAVRNMTKVRSKLLTIQEDMQNMMAEQVNDWMSKRTLGTGEQEKAEDVSAPEEVDGDYGREEAMADLEGSYRGVFSSDFSKIEAGLREAFVAQKDPNLSNSQEQRDRVAAIQSQLAEVRDDISVYSISNSATKEEIDAANARVDQLERAASAI